ncbi:MULTISPECIES: hypothetical protein [unclassified Streptomyces]|uniref:hypothetical protein n=1 Tax=unclassified Streptomyces TaxID=2593676 RepID=UPI003076A4C7
MTPEILEERDIAWNREYEWRYTSHRLEKLYSAMRAGDTSTYTSERVARLEAVLAAMQGHPSALAG